MSIGVVIVNYNLASQTIDAALSVLGDEPDAKIVIVDNHSIDDSRETVDGILSGRVPHHPTAPGGMYGQPVFAPLSDVRYCPHGQTPSDSDNIIVLHADQNAGFGAGCNIGLSYLACTIDPEIFVLLNPDAVVANGAIKAWRARLDEPGAGVCGASLVRFEDTNCIQAFGGAALNPMTLLGNNIGAGRSYADLPVRDSVEAAMDYPLGAAMAFRRDYYENIGDFDERYFLYYEEADLVRRGGDQYRPVWAPDAIVYHGHGASAGSRVDGGGRSATSDYHMARSRLQYAMKWVPARTPLIFLMTLMQAFRRLLRGKPANARAIFLGGFGLQYDL